jgi:hypothetical protein
MKQILQRFCIFSLCLLFTSFSMAQNKEVTGKVTDEKGEPVARASVLVKGTTTGTTTKSDGTFVLSVPESATTLVILPGRKCLPLHR